MGSFFSHSNQFGHFHTAAHTHIVRKDEGVMEGFSLWLTMYFSLEVCPLVDLLFAVCGLLLFVRCCSPALSEVLSAMCYNPDVKSKQLYVYIAEYCYSIFLFKDARYNDPGRVNI